MPTTPRTGNQYRSERRDERQRESAAAQRLAAVNDHPNQSEFASPDYIDEDGRQYRVAFKHKLGGWVPGEKVPPRPHDAPALRNARGHTKLWLKLKKRRGAGGNGDAGATWPAISERRALQLRPVARGLIDQNIKVTAVNYTRPGQRTGSVYVSNLREEAE